MEITPFCDDGPAKRIASGMSLCRMPVKAALIDPPGRAMRTANEEAKLRARLVHPTRWKRRAASEERKIDAENESGTGT
jgi:hypothetical protein